MAQAVRCDCCKYISQNNVISTCRALDDIANIGRSTLLYFQSVVSLSVLLLIMLMVYCVYALVTNIFASSKFKGTSNSIISIAAALDYLSISLGSKQVNKIDIDVNSRYYIIQCWLGLATTVVWFLTIFALKYIERKKQSVLDAQLNTPSDFTVSISGLPTDITIDQLQQPLNSYYRQMDKLYLRYPSAMVRPFKIRKMSIGIPFYIHDLENDKEAQQIQRNLTKLRNQIKSFVLEHSNTTTFVTSKQERQFVEKQLAETIKKAEQKTKSINNQKKSAIKSQSDKASATIVFVSFQTNYAKEYFCYLNHKTWVSLFLDNTQFSFIRGSEGYDLEIEEAPEPEDIIWTNLALTKCQKFKRKLLTYVATGIILGISFGMVYGLSDVQNRAKSSRYLSILISLTLTAINYTIGVLIRKLTAYERDYTRTRTQATLAIKSVAAQLLNSIIVPVVTTYVLSGNLYQQGGLTDYIFLLGLTTAFLTPLLKYFDVLVALNSLIRCWMAKPHKRLGISQTEFNVSYENPEFQVGFQYIYIVNLFLFCCFYCSLQPIVVSFAVIGLFMMYWVQKYCIFNRHKRPVPGTSAVNTAMWQMIYLGPLGYSLGSLTWSNFIPGGIPASALLPNLCAVGVSLLILLFPFKLVLINFVDQEGIKPCQYDECRFEFTTQYDRVNPITKEEAKIEYNKHVAQFLSQHKNDPTKINNKAAVIESILHSLPTSIPNAFLSPFFWRPSDPVVNGFNLPLFLSGNPILGSLASIIPNNNYGGTPMPYQGPAFPYPQGNYGMNAQQPLYPTQGYYAPHPYPNYYPPPNTLYQNNYFAPNNQLTTGITNHNGTRRPQ